MSVLTLVVHVMSMLTKAVAKFVRVVNVIVTVVTRVHDCCDPCT